MSWTRKLLPRSLRSRLILSFGILIFLTLFLAGSTTVLLLRDEQAETARERVGRLAEPVALRSVFLEASGATAAEIETVLYEEYGGEGGSFTDAGVLFEELGRGPVPGPHLSSGVLAALTVL